MSTGPLWLRVPLLWLLISVLGVTAPVWTLLALVWLKWRRLSERADAQLIVASLGNDNEQGERA